MPHASPGRQAQQLEADEAEAEQRAEAEQQARRHREEDAAAEQASWEASKPVPPEGWEALWSDEHEGWYFWHSETEQTFWERPGGETRGLPERGGGGGRALSRFVTANRARPSSTRGSPLNLLRKRKKMNRVHPAEAPAIGSQEKEEEQEQAAAESDGNDTDGGGSYGAGSSSGTDDAAVEFLRELQRQEEVELLELEDLSAPANGLGSSYTDTLNLYTAARSSVLELHRLEETQIASGVTARAEWVEEGEQQQPSAVAEQQEQQAEAEVVSEKRREIEALYEEHEPAKLIEVEFLVQKYGENRLLNMVPPPPLRCNRS